MSIAANYVEKISTKCHGLCGGACVGMCNMNDSQRQDIYDRSKNSVLKDFQVASPGWVDLPFYEPKSAVSTKTLYAKRFLDHKNKGLEFKPTVNEQLDYDERKLKSLALGNEWDEDPILEAQSAITPERLGVVRVQIIEDEADFLRVSANMDHLSNLVTHGDPNGDFPSRWQATFEEVSAMLGNSLYNVHSEDKAIERAPKMGVHLERVGAQLSFNARKIDAALGGEPIKENELGTDTDINSIVNARPIRKKLIEIKQRQAVSVSINSQPTGPGIQHTSKRVPG